MSDMNIKSTVQVNLATARQVDARGQEGSEKLQDASSVGSQNDTISLTNTATQLPTLKQTIADSSDVDVERVESLRAAIADGSYSVDAMKLANSMINFEQELG